MDASPATTLEVVQTELFLCLTKAVLDRPAAKGYAKNLAQRPAIAPRHSVRQEVFHFTGEDVASHDPCALVTDEFVCVSLPPAWCPAKFPDIAAAMSLLDAILLWCLFAKGG